MLVRPIGIRPAARSRATTGRVGRRGRGVAQRDRARRGHVAGDVEQVLDRDRNAGKARRRGAAPAQDVDVIGGGARLVGMDLEEDAAAFAAGVGDPGEALLDQRPARRSRRKIAGRLRQRPH